MIKRLIVDFSYFISTNESYKKTKRFFYNFLENDNYRYKKYFDIFMMILIFMSVAVLIREVKFHVNDFWLYFNNFIVSIIFFIEYILRLWVNSSVTKILIKQSEYDALLGRKFYLSKALIEILKVKFKYILSVRAIIDLLAILPFFHQLRLLRIFILFRVFKLFRYARSIKTFSSVLSTKRFEFFTLMIFAGIVIFVSSVLIYVMEANNPSSPINTMFEAIYWSIVTISTVGYGDVTPITEAGRVVAMFVIIAGIAVLAFTTSLVVSAFTEQLDEIRDTKTLDDIGKLRQFYIICGYENVAVEVAKKLLENGDNVIVLDKDYERVQKAKKDGVRSLNYDPGSTDSYKKLNIDLDKQVKAILCLRESDIENVYTALTVRSISKDIFILSLLMNQIHRHKLSFAGVNEIFYAKELVGMIAKEYVGKPVAFEVVNALRFEYSNIDIEELLINERVAQNFGSVEELHNSRYRVIILGIYKVQHKRFFFNPINSTLLEQGDYLLVIGNSVFIKEFETYLHKKIRR